MNHYLIIYSTPRLTFINDATPEESAAVEKHFEYLKSLMTENKLFLAGRDDLGTIGIAIIMADTMEEAEMIMQNDPVVSASVFTAKVKLFRLALSKDS